ncbi:stalk domain-containing protein [Cohnella herbarum]|uniref:Copper amine oxidase-like N-terminal domain-containing protein n=1 Tax=Cohnella herbarum TaxID=2728023 RepID=A0A7Z2VGD9_9BACL|nr:stalk domain-containing protein [Cohnella herbarum]QJD82622.1 hypothetical protein HH215_05070 [Cohnella herbarum]
MEVSKTWSWKMILVLIVAFLAEWGFPWSSNASGKELSTPSNKLFSNVTQIEAGQFDGFAVKEDGSAWAWGAYNASKVYYANSSAFSPVKLPIEQVKQISRGDRFYLVLKKDGTVWASGANEHGQLGNGVQNDNISLEPIQVKGLSGIKAISAGSTHGLAIDEEGKVWAWGGNDQGQLGIDSRNNALLPVKVEGLPPIVALDAGQFGSIALDNGGVIWSWGIKKYTANATDEVRPPARLTGNGEFAAVADAGDKGVALSFNGTVWTWSNYSPDQSTVLLQPVQVKDLSDIISISSYSAVKSDGTVWQWQNDQNGGTYKQVSGIEKAAKVSDAWSHHFALLEDGRVMSWGQNFFGNTGLGVIDERIETPQPIPNPIRIVLNGEEVTMPVPPIVVNQSTYVPLRGVFEKIGVKVKWDVPTRSVMASKGDTTIVLNSVTGETSVNGKVIPSDQKPISLRGSMMVPLRVIGETIGAKVDWEPATYSITIEQGE